MDAVLLFGPFCGDHPLLNAKAPPRFTPWLGLWFWRGTDEKGATEGRPEVPDHTHGPNLQRAADSVNRGHAPHQGAEVGLTRFCD
jgi:hypothetical protein